MQSKNPLFVRTAPQPADSIGNHMADMRAWLDYNRIELSSFRSISLGGGEVAFDARFRDAGQAALFRAAFARVP